MKKFFLIFICTLVMFMTSACSDKAGILFNNNPITEKNVLDNSVKFMTGQRIYYLILVPKKVRSRYLYIQVVKKDNDYGRLGYDLYWSRNVRLKDEEVNYFTDYVVINQKGFYIMQVYSKDNPTKRLAAAEFYVQNP